MPACPTSRNFHFNAFSRTSLTNCGISKPDLAASDFSPSDCASNQEADGCKDTPAHNYLKMREPDGLMA